MSEEKKDELFNDKTYHHDLYFGGGCFPNALLCADLGDKESFEKLKQQYSYKSAGLGFKNTGPVDQASLVQAMKGELWPAPPICMDDEYPSSIAAHRGPVDFALSRHLCFVCPGVDEKKFRKAFKNQDALWRYYLNQRCTNMEVPFSLGTVIVPPKHVLHGVAFDNYCVAEGVTFDVIERFTGEVYFEGLDASELGCGFVKAAEGTEMVNHQRVIDICVNSMPPLNEDPCKPDAPSMLDGWCIMVSALVCCVDTGNG
jgi:hypothetical protein